MSYKFLTIATVKKLATNEIWLKQVNDESIMDVSLNAGQLVINQPNIEESFIPFSQHLNNYCQRLAQQFPFIEFSQQQEFHCTLLTIFNQQAIEFKQKKSILLTWCDDIAELFKEIGSIDILFNQVVLTPNGSVILTGISAELEAFRQKVYQQIPIENNLHKNIIHITLGRLRENAPADKIESFYNHLVKNQSLLNADIMQHSITIKHPKFVVSKGSLSADVIDNLTREFNK